MNVKNSKRSNSLLLSNKSNECFILIVLLEIISISNFHTVIAEDSQIAYFPSPRHQIQSGVEPVNVTCTEGLQLILKKLDGMPACVQLSSVEPLINRGWAVHFLPDYIKDEKNNSEMLNGANQEVTSEVVNYFDNFQGYLSRPVSPGTYPGIIMIHEWWGLNDNIKQMTQELASEGYVVLAVDLYGIEAATTTDEARKLVSSYDLESGISNMNAAVDFLESNYNSEKIGSIGWCFGGGQSLNLALNNPEIYSTVIYYGQLTADKTQLSKINWPVLGIFAELDQGIPPSSVNEFELSLNDLGIDNEIFIYPNVNHAFANPSGTNYAPEETKDAWNKTLIFLKTHLQ